VLSSCVIQSESLVKPKEEEPRGALRWLCCLNLIGSLRATRLGHVPININRTSIDHCSDCAKWNLHEATVKPYLKDPA